jgi:hypothetical protein
MKFFMVTVFLLALLAPSVPAQSTPTPSDSAHNAESKQDKKNQKTKTKSQKETSKTKSPDAGKKTSSAQDAAYAAAYKSGIPK